MTKLNKTQFIKLNYYSRAEIEELSGLSKPTVLNRLQAIVPDLVTTVDGSRGRHAHLYKYDTLALAGFISADALNKAEEKKAAQRDAYALLGITYDSVIPDLR